MVDHAVPNFQHEHAARAAGYRLIAGVDEAGRGALAGPVAAAAVIPPLLESPAGVWAEVRDSKMLTPDRRATLFDQIQADAFACAISTVDAAVIDRIGIAAAARRAMTQAVASLEPPPDFLLIDWVRLPLLPIAQKSFAKADRYSVAVAAASILAKVYRDRIMIELDATYPHYSFASNKGYGARVHLDAIAGQGPCAVHRHSFAPIAARRPTLFGQS